MNKFKVGDRVRLIHNAGMSAKMGATALVVNPKEYNFSNYGDSDYTRYTYVVWDAPNEGGQANGGYYHTAFELVERPWEFEVGKYYRNIRDKDHIVRVNAFTPEVVYFTVVSSLRVKSGDYHLGYEFVKRVWEPCPAPKRVVKKSGWIIVEHRDTVKGSKAIAQCPVFDTEEEAKKWVSDKFHHVKIESVKYYKIEWEEAAKVEDDDMV